MKKAQKYYQELATRAVKAQLICDFFGFALDQFGLYEMKTLAEKTGGYVVVQEEFEMDIFRDSYLKLFEVNQDRHLKTASNAQLEVFVSKELKLQGAIGPCVSLKKAGPMVSDQSVGQGGTNLWYLGGMDYCTTVALYLDIVNNDAKVTHHRQANFIQF